MNKLQEIKSKPMVNAQDVEWLLNEVERLRGALEAIQYLATVDNPLQGFKLLAEKALNPKDGGGAE